jgi:hypothetical protein
LRRFDKRGWMLPNTRRGSERIVFVEDDTAANFGAAAAAEAAAGAEITVSAVEFDARFVTHWAGARRW